MANQLVAPSEPRVLLYQGDALKVLRAIESNIFDSAVTDGPYGLTSRFAVNTSRFPGHRKTGRGFLGRKWDASLPDPEVWSEALRILKPGAFLLAFGGTRTYHRLACDIEDAGFLVRDMIEWVQTQGMPKCFDLAREIAKLDRSRAGEWRGWQLNLKPAHEPILLAQKPLSESTFAANVLRWGVGALHVDACRSPFLDDEDRKLCAQRFPGDDPSYQSGGYGGGLPGGSAPSELGRYPADVVTLEGDALGEGGHVFAADDEAQNVVRVRKASRRERTHAGIVDNEHPTVKPLRLMRWLVRLVTPRGGLVLDPFAGSGTTGLAALDEGCSAVLVERERAYVEIAMSRLGAYQNYMTAAITSDDSAASA